ncbi:conserved protein of unknown function [Candidatus Hydrogenisulfobacillus filiaventi]|uniref:DEAD/DEAH box helicase n=1 Tax=Candidatus Hydrogenisulfobacillus filiaventi TaxID=2707344 RepID=A0A6F8ZJE8_9FIRM|nr:conserved protein of unknown function [Candidatus Hydrogenisulfobacillus filiaventi]
MVEMRPYQREAAEAISQQLASGPARTVVSLPTGTGKTVTAVAIARQLGHRVLWIAHRGELLDQAGATFRRVWPEASVGVVQAERNEADAHVVLASVQSLTPKRLAQWAPDAFPLVVVDEAHHAPSPVYRRAIDHFRPRLLLGLTATPFRGDKISLATVFPHGIAYAYPIQQAIREGYLADIVAYRVQGSADLDRVRIQAGDFAPGELERAVNTAGRNAIIVRAYQQYAPGLRAVVFAVGVDHARALADTFRAAGVPAEAVDGSMSRNDRQAALQRLHTGETPVICNAMLLTEGFDEPSIGAVILARPTQSLGLYTQMLGRGTRIAPGKDAVIVIDVVDATRRHKLASIRTLLGLRKEPEQGTRVSERMAREARLSADAEAWLARLWPDRVEAERVLDLYEDLAGADAPYADWRDVARDLAEIREDPDLLREQRKLAASRMQYPDAPPSEAQAKRLRDFGWPQDEVARLTRWEASYALDAHKRAMDAWIRHRVGIWRELWGDRDDIGGRLSGALWQIAPATEAQRRLLRRLGAPAEIVESVTKGEASWLIDEMLAARGARATTR